MDDTTEVRERRRRITDQLRRYGADASRVVDVFAKLHTMHPTDLQALVVILDAERQGIPATPGVLRQQLNLTSGAVTGTVDRLVRNGHVRREPDPHDRRQVRLHQASAGAVLGQDFFGPLGQRVAAAMAGYGEPELAVIEEFMTAMADATAEHLRWLEDRSSQNPRSRPQAKRF